MQNWEKFFSVSVGEGMGIDDEKNWLTLTHTLNLSMTCVCYMIFFIPKWKEENHDD
jgi:hypothetical protein